MLIRGFATIDAVPGSAADDYVIVGERPVPAERISAVVQIPESQIKPLTSTNPGQSSDVSLARLPDESSCAEPNVPEPCRDKVNIVESVSLTGMLYLCLTPKLVHCRTNLALQRKPRHEYRFLSSAVANL